MYCMACVTVLAIFNLVIARGMQTDNARHRLVCACLLTTRPLTSQSGNPGCTDHMRTISYKMFHVQGLRRGTMADTINTCQPLCLASNTHRGDRRKHRTQPNGTDCSILFRCPTLFHAFVDQSSFPTRTATCIRMFDASASRIGRSAGRPLSNYATISHKRMLNAAARETQPTTPEEGKAYPSATASEAPLHISPPRLHLIDVPYGSNFSLPYVLMHHIFV